MNGCLKKESWKMRLIKVNESLVLRERMVRASRPLYGPNERGVLLMCWVVPYVIWVVATSGVW